MSFGGLQFTNRGLALQAKGQTGTNIQFTRIAVGDGYLGGSIIADLTALKNQIKTLSINKLTLIGSGQAVVGAALSNQDLGSGFYWREIGVFATDPDVGEILYCYGNAGNNAEWIPAGGGPDILEKQVDVISIVGNAQNVSAIINQSLVFATKTEFDTLKTRFDTLENDVVKQAPAALTLDPSNQVKSVTDSTDGLIDAEVGGRTTNNILGTTGSFKIDSNADGLADGWAGVNAGTYALLNGVQTFTPTAQYGRINVGGVKGASGRTIFIASNVSTADNTVFVDTDGTPLAFNTHTGSGKFERIGRLVTTTSTTATHWGAATSKTSGFVPISVEKSMRVDVTDYPELVGMTAAQKLAWCLANLEYCEGIQGSSDLTIEASGNQLFNPTVGSVTVNGVTITVDLNGYITLNGTATATKYVKLTNGLAGLTGATDTALTSQKYPLKKVIHSIGYKDVSGTSSGDIYRPWIGVMYNDGTFTLGSDYPATLSKNNIIAKDVSGVALYFSSGNVFNNFKFRIMLNEGAAVLPYEVYKGKKLTIKCTNPAKFIRHKVQSGAQNEINDLGKGYPSAVKRLESGADGKGYAIQSSDVEELGTSTANIDWVRIKMPANVVSYLAGSEQSKSFETNFSTPAGATYADSAANVGKHFYGTATWPGNYLIYVVAKGAYANLAAAKADLTNKRVVYLTATPEFIPFESFGDYGIELIGALPSFDNYTQLSMVSSDITPTVTTSYSRNMASSVDRNTQAIASLLTLTDKHEIRLDALDIKLSTSRLNKDLNGLYTEIQFKRKDGTLFKKSVLSGGTSPKYTTRTETFYAADGTTVTQTDTYTLTYTGNDLTSEVITP